LAFGVFDFNDLTLTRTVSGNTSGNLITASVTTSLKSGTTSTYVVSGMGGLTIIEGVYSLTVAGTGVSDPAGNTGTGSVNRTWTTDTTAPIGKLEQAGGQADPTTGSTVQFSVHFSESVTGFGQSGVSVIRVPGARVLSVTGEGADYVVHIGGYTSTGTITAELLAGAATDSAGNPNAVDSSGDKSVRVDPTRTPTPIAVGAGFGGAVRFYNADGSLRSAFQAFGGPVAGVRTAVGDFNGDGTPDLAVGTGPGIPTHVRIFDGQSRAELFNTAPFEAAFISPPAI
jgi:hypothetical protein